MRDDARGQRAPYARQLFKLGRRSCVDINERGGGRFLIGGQTRNLMLCDGVRRIPAWQFDASKGDRERAEGDYQQERRPRCA